VDQPGVDGDPVDRADRVLEDAGLRDCPAPEIGKNQCDVGGDDSEYLVDAACDRRR